jgi:hypothetical protein
MDVPKTSHRKVAQPQCAIRSHTAQCGHAGLNSNRYPKRNAYPRRSRSERKDGRLLACEIR